MKINIKLIILLAITSTFLLGAFVNAQAKPADIYFFYGDGCPHCHKEEAFLQKLESQYGDKIKVHRFEVWDDRDNAKLLQEAAKRHNITAGGVPVTLIGENEIVGFGDEQTTGKQILNYLESCLNYGCICPAQDLFEAEECPEPISDQVTETNTTFNLPIIGEVDLAKFSLPLLTVIIGGLDGFNPCAMWVLIFLISLLLGMKSRKRMWLLGSVFILASGVVYFIFLAAWLNLFLFIGYLKITRWIIGVLAISIGAYNLNKWRKNRAGVCEVTDSEKRKKIFDRLKEIIETKTLYLALGGIILLAFAVNMVELACSAGFPAIYTNILALNELAVWKYYAYLAFYILFFMIDDMLVFAAAMITLRVTGISGKYSKYSNLIGGAIILILGILLILKPGWLMFG